MALARSQGPAPSPASASEMARARDSLARLAKVLGVPVSAFHPVAGEQDEAIVQAADLVTEFAAIDNPAARRTCLAFVRAMASS
ncbi:hypothetical protein SAMN05216360_11530 [Methylobacterium phyllostachyos]|uniref:Uncharacterized protein n=1 Tax=Methylobacterium phyllostachyos TaxID=582672 RepID=A0A1H0H079_9HYPH|nr:hypothetical protein [Methylobacterium phyllostachyos]SDO12666.1 hypothetical protein SAMN05216360_11530 [Methylobacterium phyllostachyos]